MIWDYFKHLHYFWHLIAAGVVRLVLIGYGVYHDENFSVPYTDVDYKVFTDAARHIVKGGSPYDRHTYRYSPIIAFLVIPNINLHPLFGKVLFSLFDLIVGLLIRNIVKSALKEYENYKQKSDCKEENLQKIESGTSLSKPNIKNVRNRKKNKNFDKRRIKSEHDLQADLSMMLWLYNPLTIGISTRGNSDSIAGLLVLLTVYCIQCKKFYFLGGLIHGISIHTRLYPIIYSLAFFMHLSKYSYYMANHFKQNNFEKNNQRGGKKVKNQVVQNLDKNIALTTTNIEERRTIFKKQYLLYLIPNLDQLKLILGCALSLIPLTYLFYRLYGYQFLYETYIYHVVRKDTRHNFSVFFYLQYLTAGVKNIGLWQKILIVLPQIVLLSIFSIRYGLNRFALNFSILTLTVTAVIYNTVLTSQYFVWILVVLPLCTWQIKMSAKTSVFLVVIWAAAQAAWLMPAYFLEFQGQNTFLFIWMQSVSFFCANIAILGRLIMNFMPAKKLKSA